MLDMSNSKNDELRNLVKQIRAARPDLDIPAEPTRTQLLELLAAEPTPAPRLVALNVRIPAGLREDLKIHAAKAGSTIQDVVSEAIRAHLNNQ